MRVISGKYKGLNIDGYNLLGTRPTQDRVKESMFSMIQDYIYDSVCLDLFSGSGNLGIELLSNYSKFVYFNDHNKDCIKVINKNLLKVDNNFKVLSFDYNKCLDYLKENNIKLDIILLDPPYNLDCIDKVINKLITNNLLNNNSIIVCEYENDFFNKEYQNLEIIKEKKYGYKKVRIYKYCV